jgi:murein L,D-transpeptidase YcbB/YkuD
VSYLTANAEDGKVAFADDVYGLDPKVELAQAGSAGN